MPAILSAAMVFQSIPAPVWASPNDTSDNNNQYVSENQDQNQNQYQDEQQDAEETVALTELTETEEEVPEEEPVIYEESDATILNSMKIPDGTVVSDITDGSLSAAADWRELNWSEGEENESRYYRLPSASGNYAVLLSADNENAYLSNGVTISGNKVVSVYNSSPDNNLRKLYDIRNYYNYTFASTEAEDVYIKIEKQTNLNYNASKFKVVQIDLFDTASKKAVSANVAGEKKIYSVEPVNPFYDYDLLLKFDVPEKGLYALYAARNSEENADNFNTVILNSSGNTVRNMTNYENTLELEAGTYYLAYKYGDYLLYDDDNWGDPVDMQLYFGRVTGLSTENKEDTEAAVSYGYSGGEYVNKDTPEEYYKFNFNAFYSVLNFLVEFESGQKIYWLPSSGEKNAVSLEKTDFAEWNIIGETYPVTFSWKGMDFSANVKLKNYNEFTGYTAIEEDVPADVDYSDSYTFCAPEAGTYYFYSSEAGEADPQLTFTRRGNSKNDDDSLDGKNFLVSQYLKAGEKVELYCSYNNKPGSYKVTVSRMLPKIAAVKLDEFDLSGKTINLVFVVDITGSMGDEITAVRNNLKAFVDRITATHANLRMSLISFEDITPGNGEDETIIYYNDNADGSVWYENFEADDLKNVINDNLKAHDGGDTPECAVDALGNLVFDDIYTFNSAAAKFAFLITDAKYKNDNIHGIADMDELIDLLVKKNIAVTTITEKNNYETYTPLTSKTGGTLLNINDDFARGMDRFAYDIVKAAETYVVDPSIVPVTKIELGEDMTVPLGRTRNFTPVITPSNASNKDVAWRVKDTDIAKIVTVGPNLLAIKGIKEGSTKVIAFSKDGGYSASFEFSVSKSVVTGDSVESCDIRDLIDGYMDDDTLNEFRLITDTTETTKVDPGDQKTVYEKIKSKDKTFGFEFMDKIGDLSYLWRFKGEKISDPEKTVSDFAMALDPKSKAGALAVAEGFKAYLPIGFKHHGDLPGSAEIGFVSDLIKNGTYDLYYYNEAANKLEATGKTVTVSGNVSTFDVEHCSTYVIGSKDPAKSNAIEIKFESNGGSNVVSQTLLIGQKVTKPADPVKEGFAFSGWYKDAAYTEAWDFDTDVVSGITILYAKWDIPVDSVALDKTEALELIAGDRVALSATISPATATNKALVWTSSDDKVASVANGTITAVGSGKASITVASAQNAKATASIEVMVSAMPTDTIIVKGSVVLKPGAKVKSWEFEEGYKNIISAKKSAKACTVKGKAKGTVSIKAVMKDGSEKSFVVRVEKAALNDRSFDTIGEKLNVKELISGTRLAETTKFKSSNKKIISVDPKTGEMTVLKNGKVSISATFGKTTVKKTYKVTMPEAAKKSVSVKAGKSVNIKIKNFNAALGDYSIVFDKGGFAEAEIDPAKGEIVIKGIAKGSAKAHLYVGGKDYGTFKVKVKK
ncbi:MAG: Ig-like domain-containing protein [Lachnospiraceae bacterium]|nr:Ig-like domain-containing protein [Lachnospiraceae bacterium]